MRIAKISGPIILTILLVAIVCIVCYFGSLEEEPYDDVISDTAPSIDDVYEMACEARYEGTLEELVALFKGEQGAAGVAGVGITSVVVNDAGELIITLSDGSVIDCGTVVGKGDDGVGIKSAEVDPSGKLLIALTDGSVIDCGTVVSRGTDGVGVENVEISDAGHLLVTLTDGSVIDCGTVVGEGDDGVGIESAEVDFSGKLLITLTDGSVVDCGTVVRQGADGVGVENVEISNAGHLLVTLTDGSVVDCGELPGYSADDTADVTVSFSSEGAEIDPITVSRGSYINLPVPEREGFIFEGWYYRLHEDGVNAARVTNLTPIMQSMTLTAVWHGHSDLRGGILGGTDGLCDDCGISVCGHIYSENWSADASGHFYEYECGCQLMPTVLDHSDLRGGVSDGVDGCCDDCGYVLCHHSYDTAWYSDEIYHWHAADCGCDVSAVDTDTHRDADDDDFCDFCAAEVTWDRAEISVGVTDIVVAEAGIPMVFEFAADRTTVYTLELPGLIYDIYRLDGYVVSEGDGFVAIALHAGDSVLFALEAEAVGEYELAVEALMPIFVTEGSNTIVLFDNLNAVCFLLVAAESGVYTITADGGLEISTYPECITEDGAVSVTLSAGAELVVFMSASEAGEYSFNITYPCAEPPGAVSEIKFDPEECNESYVFSFSVPTDGNYTFLIPAYVGFHSAEAESNWLSPEVLCEDNTSGATVSFYLTAGQEFVFKLEACVLGPHTVSIILE